MARLKDALADLRSTMRGADVRKGDFFAAMLAELERHAVSIHEGRDAIEGAVERCAAARNALRDEAVQISRAARAARNRAAEAERRRSTDRFLAIALATTFAIGLLAGNAAERRFAGDAACRGAVAAPAKDATR